MKWLKDIDIRVAIPILAVAGLIGTLFYILQFPEHQAWSVLATAGITAGAAAFVGALFGLLFGIPRARDDSGGAPSGTGLYVGNTNLVKISDWLTTLLVGAGLVQLGRAPKAFSELANALSSGFGGVPSSAGYGLALVFFYTGCGFLYMYLWARLKLPGELTQAESAQKQVQDLGAVTAKLSAATPAPVVSTGGHQELAANAAPPTVPTEGVSPLQLLRPAAAGFGLVASVVAPLASAKLPRSSLSVVRSQIEKQLRELLAATGHSDAITGDLDSMAEALKSAVQVDSVTLDALRQFSQVYQTLIDQGSAVDESVLRDAVDSGLDIARAIADIPRARHIVAFINVGLFSDERATTPIAGASGVILRTVDPDGTSSLQIFPTARTDYQVGQELSWDWNPNLLFSEAWYHDPANQEIKQAWIASVEFVGRDLSSI